MVDTAKLPKSATIRMQIVRVQKYLDAHPGCNLREAAEILDIYYSTFRKWKSNGWITHKRAHEIRKEQSMSQALATEAEPPAPARPAKKSKTPSGAVASPPDAPEESIAGDERAESSLKISALRNMIKNRIRMSIGDAQSVSQYAAALKALAGVQDVELEEIYEQEKIIRIYCPEEEPVPKKIKEVDPIEY